MSTKIEIFGTQYIFDGDDPERIKLIADYVDRKMRDTAQSIRNITTSKVAVMAAMNIADDLFKLRESLEQASKSSEERIDKLIAMTHQLGLPHENDNQQTS